MTEATHDEKALAEPSDARFSLQWLLGAMTCVAVMAAIGGEILKRCNPDTRTRLVVFWAAWLATLIIIAIFAFRQRKRAEQDVGCAILQLPVGLDSELPHWLKWSSIRLTLILLGGWALTSFMVASENTPTSASDWAAIMAPILLLVWCTAQIVTLSLWGDQIRFAENGILYDRKILAWDQLLDYKWAGSDLDKLQLNSIDAPNNLPWLQIHVSEKNRAAVSELIDSKLSGAHSLPPETLRIGLGQIPISKLVLQPHLRRRVIPALIGILCGLGLVYLGLRVGAGTREFDESIQIVCVAGVLIVSLRRQWTPRHAGEVLARVFARRDWLGLIVTVLLAIGFYYAARHFFWLPTGAGYIVGFAYCCLTISALSYFFTTQLDLRVKGVVMPGAFFWPWSQVRLGTWDRDGSGRLVLKRRWRWVVATVLPEQREAVDAVLREKLGANVAGALRHGQVDLKGTSLVDERE